MPVTQESSSPVEEEPGRYISRIRKARKIRQGECARNAHISQSYLSELESGRRRMTPELFIRLANALSVYNDGQVVSYILEKWPEEGKPQRLVIYAFYPRSPAAEANEDSPRNEFLQELRRDWEALSGKEFRKKYRL